MEDGIPQGLKPPLSMAAERPKAEALGYLEAEAEALGYLEAEAEAMGGLDVGVLSSASWYSPSYLKVCKVFQRKELSPDFQSSIKYESPA